MIPIQAMLATYHLDDLRRAAAHDRLAHAAATNPDPARHGTGGATGTGDARRVLARVAAGVSRGAADAARWLDPGVEVARARRRSAVPGC